MGYDIERLLPRHDRTRQQYNAHPKRTTRAQPTIDEDTELRDGEEPQDERTILCDKDHDKDWTLPKRQQYKVIEKKGRYGKPHRKGTVLAKDRQRLCVGFEDGWSEYFLNTSVVEIEVASQPPR